MTINDSADDFQNTLKKSSEIAVQRQEDLKIQLRKSLVQIHFPQVSVILKRWTVQEYDAMLEKGILTERDRVELVNGQIIEMSPQNPPHAAATNRAANLCNTLFAGLALVRTQTPVVLNDNSKPEPDIAIVKLDEQEYSDRHSTGNDIFLIIEISDETIYFDLNEKALAYAKSDIEDYWVIDVRRRQAHILRQPVNGVYMQKKIFKLIDANSQENPLAFSTVTIPLLNLLPLN